MAVVTEAELDAFLAELPNTSTSEDWEFLYFSLGYKLLTSARSNKEGFEKVMRPLLDEVNILRHRLRTGKPPAPGPETQKLMRASAKEFDEALKGLNSTRLFAELKAVRLQLDRYRETDVKLHTAVEECIIAYRAEVNLFNKQLSLYKDGKRTLESKLPVLPEPRVTRRMAKATMSDGETPDNKVTSSTASRPQQLADNKKPTSSMLQLKRSSDKTSTDKERKSSERQQDTLQARDGEPPAKQQDHLPVRPRTRSKGSMGHPCKFCKGRKIKCDQEQPCDQCSRRTQSCDYSE